MGRGPLSRNCLAPKARRSQAARRGEDSCNAKPPALKARFIPALICVGLTANRCVESRFQRLFIIRSESWGDAPGWYESALLALNRYPACAQRFASLPQDEPVWLAGWK